MICFFNDVRIFRWYQITRMGKRRSLIVGTRFLPTTIQMRPLPSLRSTKFCFLRINSNQQSSLVNIKKLVHLKTLQIFVDVAKKESKVKLFSPNLFADAERNHEYDRQHEQGERLPGAQHEGDRLVEVVKVVCSLVPLQSDCLCCHLLLQFQNCQESFPEDPDVSFVREDPDPNADRQKCDEGDDGAEVNGVRGDADLKPDWFHRCAILK